ncbi:DDB1- and CUL4-associated factor 11-like isoform X2 [Dreissena polymorpha]|uniref:DDB1- and CUL4-associated factor 11-like isoform X2 n=1 Tax=Dreissena polymorpha TaxID=45954 RepID=UPI0022654F1A|nr:DDB1- and CUL4-associated factor 11-like isoform X2 [Dreissena polymorpha]
MGSINSSNRRRRMSGSLDLSLPQREELSVGNQSTGSAGDEREGQETVEVTAHDSDSSTDLSAILAYLIRSGQVRLLSTDPDDDEYASEEECFDKSQKPVADSNPDTSRIKNNDIYEEIMLRSGRSSALDKSHSTVTHMIYKRQIGMKNHGNFTPSDRRVICKPFLPNFCETIGCYRQKVFCGTYSVDGNIFLAASQDHNIRVYDTRDDEFNLMKVIRARDVGWSVLDTAFSPDGNYVAYSSWSDSIHLCNVYGEEEVHQSLLMMPTENSFCIFSLMFSSDNREILGGANDGNLYVYDRDNGRRSLKIDAHDDDVNAVAFADDNSQILFSGGDDGLIKVWDRRMLREESPVPVGALAGHYDGITYIDSKGDARYLLSNSKDQTMKLWDIRSLSSKNAVEQTKKAVSKQRWDYRWQQVPKKMHVKPRLEGDTSLMTYRGHSVLHTLIRCRFSPKFSTGQRYVYTGCALGNIVVYDTLSGDIVRKLEGHRSCVRDVNWHPFENNIVSASWDGTLRKWMYVSPDKYEDLQDPCLRPSSSEDESGEDEDGGRRQSVQQRQQKRKRSMSSSSCYEHIKHKGLFD